MKLPEALWRETKIAVIREDVTVSDYVRKALEASLGAGSSSRDGPGPRPQPIQN